MQKFTLSVALAWCVCVLAGSTQGATAKPVTPAGALTIQFKSNDAAQVKQALQAALEMLGDDKSSKSAAEELPNWLKVLLAQKRLNEIEQLALAGIAAQPASLPIIENCQKYRIRVHLVSGKTNEALALAKGLYNVCAMSSTSRAIDLIGECLYEANKDNDPAGVVKEYKLHQIHGAALTTTGQAAIDPRKSVLSEVHVDAKPYAKAIADCELNVDGFTALLAKGNLLLLADQPAEAKKAFEKIYALAADKNLAVATEANARAMRAEDGTVGRANAWILSLRPQESGQ